jgi:hypothetical protein
MEIQIKGLPMDGKKKVLWFTSPQLDVLNELIKITGDSNSKIVRDALAMYLKSLR